MMTEGDWVFASYRGQKVTGFLLLMRESTVLVQATIPNDLGIIEVSTDRVSWNNNAVICMDDLPELIDLSLDWKDKEWFEKWTNELSLWKRLTDQNVSMRS
ncbi:IDEAL domain-containing protein [Paenibacillus cellulositrophicus]|uniref:IDEAL domain-containing protein n=1 Tax=Paenibacillus cellulositrophicus TaxID=562959 RepID=UPI0012677C60|nr:IDEAL domain-containing protein [Paenibacillus cellulositrophicus]